MNKENIIKLHKLNKRLARVGFSWQHEDCFLLQDTLSKLLKSIEEGAPGRDDCTCDLPEIAKRWLCPVHNK